ncbi:MAG: hypothetical protein HY738_00635 [Bacteroidia bacterium]|nr:hypothetical protein [Bacteroidia bacterium]
MSITKLWISFDLGVNGNYEAMYRWLDNHGALECGDNFAFIPKYKYQGIVLDYLRRDIERNIRLRKGVDRIYMFSSSPLKASFVVGNRKRAPWTGYGVSGISGLDI